MHCVVLVTFARETKRKRARLSRSRFTLSRAYESCLACQRLFLTGNLLAHTPQKNGLSTLTVFVRILLIDGPKILRYHKTVNWFVPLNFLSAFPRRERSLQNLEANAPFCLWPHARSQSITSCDAIWGYALLHPVEALIIFRFTALLYWPYFSINF